MTTQILVVEDKSIVAADIRRRLASLGYGVSAIVGFGEEAIEEAARLRPDLVLMDIMLKGEMDGVEAAHHIRERLDIPVIYLTAHSDEATLQRAKIAEPFGYILKPFEERELYTNIEIALYRHHIERQLRRNNLHLSLVNQIARRLSAILDMDQLLAEVVELVQANLGHYHVSAALTEGQELVVRAVASEDQLDLLGTRLKVGEQGISGWAAAHGQLLNVPDVSHEPRYLAHPALSRTHSALSAPLQAGGHCLGVLHVESERPASFDKADEAVLQAIADQLALALQNALSFQETQTQRDEATSVAHLLFEQTSQIVSMNRVSTALLAITNLDEAAQAFVGDLRDELDIHKSMLWLVDALSGKLRLAASTGLPSCPNPDNPQSEEWPALVQVWRSGQQDSQGQFIARGGQASRWEDCFDDWVMYPVKTHQEVLGVVVAEQITLNEDILRIFLNQAALGLLAARSYERLDAEQKHSDSLLRVILPDMVVEELKTTDRVKPRRYEHVAVLFCDIVGFTAYCDQHEPEDVLFYLQTLVEAFEDLAVRHHLQKIKTNGDAFMAAAGLLESVENPVLNCVRCGLDMLVAARRLPVGWKVRVGIHVGPVIAGVVGHRRYSFDIWGDTVNTAARVEEHGRDDTVNVSATAWQDVAHTCHGESLGLIQAKGKGEIELYRIIESE
ncbi:MAG: response regulator [Thermoflexales bacterium]|nr:response regulator [Thermoflexales bacterium]